MADEIENDEGFDTPVERTTNVLDNLSIQEERVIEVRRRRRRRRTTRMRTSLLTWRFLLLRLGRGHTVQAHRHGRLRHAADANHLARAQAAH